MEIKDTKIFGIGFHKTGTTSLGKALSCLGYRVHGGVTSNIACTKEEAKKKAKKLCKSHDALQDMPWPILYRWFDKEYKDSKFILTVRNKDDWIKSVCKHFGNRNIKRHKWIYGKADPIGNEKLYLKRYKKHNKNVREYFKNRIGKDLIVVNITKGDGWKKICGFLGDKEPKIPFPKSNVSYEKWEKYDTKNKLRHYLHNVFYETTSKYRSAMKSFRRGNLIKRVRRKMK